MKNLKITIIIPVFNEEKIIKNSLQQFLNYPNLEVIIVDGNSQDNTRKIIKDLSKSFPHLKLVISDKLGRANQMNYGASLASKDMLLFLHADTILPDRYPEIISKILQQPHNILGAFRLKIDGQQNSLRIVEKMVDLRSYLLSLPYGDQGLFITKKNFHLLGGFADLPIMEDFDLVRRAKKQGKIAIAKEQVFTSPRRWQKLGVLKTTIINQLIVIGYYLRISPYKLRNLYRNFK